MFAPPSILGPLARPLYVAAAGGGDITTGLVGWWRFDEGTGSTATDSGSGGHNGTLVSSPTWVSGQVGSGALTFNGANYVTMGNVLDQSGAAAFSLACWMKTTQGGAFPLTLMGKNALSSPFPGYQFGLNVVTGTSGDAGKLGVTFVNGSGTVVRRQSTAALNDGSWHHVVMTYDGSKTRAGILLYIDGALAAMTDANSASFSGSLSTSAAFEIGARDGAGQAIPGTLDDARFYSRALSAADIATLYAYR